MFVKVFWIFSTGTQGQIDKQILFIIIALIFCTVAQWLRCCATNRKVAGSIPAGVIGIFH